MEMACASSGHGNFRLPVYFFISFRFGTWAESTAVLLRLENRTGRARNGRHSRPNRLQDLISSNGQVGVNFGVVVR